MIAMSLTALAMPWLTKIVIDDVIIGKNFQLLAIILLCIVLIHIFRQFFLFLSHYLAFYIGERAIFSMRNKLFRQLQYLSIRYYDTKRVGDILARVMSDVSAIDRLFISGVLTLVSDIFTLIIAVAITTYISWQITLIALMVLPLYAWSLVHYRKRIKHSAVLVREKVSELTGRLGEIISGIKVVRAFTAETHERRQFGAHTRDLFDYNLNCKMLGVRLSMNTGIITGIGSGTILCFGAYSVIKGSMSLGELSAILGYTMMLFSPIAHFTSLNNIVQQAMAAVDRIFEVLDTKGEEKRVRYGSKLERIKGHIILDDVSYSYGNDIPALEHICLEAVPGEVVALVGSSGCGKSTLISLLLRFYDPTGGRIYLDGHDIAHVNPRSIRERTGVVLQEVFLFSGSIMENIRYGRRDATREEVLSASQAANAHDFIMRLPQGYATEVHEKGAGLSVGERQRIAIARAIVRDPAIIIFDEATSSLDSSSEKLVQKALENVSIGRTTFIIAHRLSTILHADKIVVMEQGRIVEMGTHERLFSMGNFYRELCEAQFING